MPSRTPSDAGASAQAFIDASLAAVARSLALLAGTALLQVHQPAPPQAAAELRFQPVPLHTDSGDGAGEMVLADGRLVAVLVRLADPGHGGLVGHWHLEAGFGPCIIAAQACPVFGDLDAARRWIERRLA